MAMPETSNDQNSKVCDVSEVLEKFGKYQAIQFLFVCVPVLCITMVNINYIFVAGDINYRCRIPECEGPSGEFNVSWWPNATVDRCSKPLLRADHTLDSQCTDDSFSGELGTCEEWVYESNNTVVASLNMACHPWLSNLVGTIHNAGMVISVIVGGWMTDRFGRKPTLVFCAVGSAVGQLKTITTSYYMYAVVEFCEAAITGCIYPAAMVLMLEICGKKNRAVSGVIFTYASILGECLYAVIAMFVPYWKNFIHIINAPSVFFLFLNIIINESLRWQIVCGKIDEAKKAVMMVAKINNINIDREKLANMNEAELKSKFNVTAAEKREGLIEIVKSKEIMKRAVVAAFWRFTSVLTYYGMMINAAFLSGNKYINFLFLEAMSFPGIMISLYLMRSIGRKRMLLVVLLLSGLVCIGVGFIPARFTWAKILLFSLGKMLAGVCFTSTATYSMELFPTSVRASLFGFGTVAAKFGGMMAPITPILNLISEALPPILFGCSAILSASLLMLTPETKDLPLMETIQHMEESIRNAKEKRNKKTEDNTEIETGCY